MRRFETDYAGAWRGFCKTRESAIIAAVRHLVSDGYKRATVTDRETGQIVARLEVAYNKRGIAIGTTTQLKKI